MGSILLTVQSPRSRQLGDKVAVMSLTPVFFAACHANRLLLAFVGIRNGERALDSGSGAPCRVPRSDWNSWSRRGRVFAASLRARAADRSRFASASRRK